jgi:serine/threonine-protein kinase
MVSGDTPDKVKVPVLVGETLKGAKAKAANVELDVHVTGSKPCDDQPEGRVCSQDPAEGKVEQHTVIDLVMSTGAPKVTVPDVRGLSYDEAVKQLKEQGFESVERQDKESDQTPNTVIGQKPSGDSKVEKGTTITLTVAKEKQKVTVPDVTGKTFDEAKALLEAAGLTAQRQDVENGSVEAGKVIQTQPTAGTEVDKGQSVTVQVAKAAQQVQVPSIAGQRLGDAKKTLQSAGLAVGTITGPQDDNAIVMTTDPGANQQVAPGTPINITTVGGGPGGNGGQGGQDNGGVFGGQQGLTEERW